MIEENGISGLFGRSLDFRRVRSGLEKIGLRTVADNWNIGRTGFRSDVYRFVSGEP